MISNTSLTVSKWHTCTHSNSSSFQERGSPINRHTQTSSASTAPRHPRPAGAARCCCRRGSALGAVDSERLSFTGRTARGSSFLFSSESRTWITTSKIKLGYVKEKQSHFVVSLCHLDGCAQRLKRSPWVAPTGALPRGSPRAARPPRPTPAAPRAQEVTRRFQTSDS